jgi:hypothetical protein
MTRKIRTIPGLLRVAFAAALTVAITGSVSQTRPISFVKKVGGQEVVICPVEKVTETRDLPLSEIIESCEMVKLDAGENALIGQTWFPAISENHICIVSHGNIPVKLFDRKTGKFLCEVGIKGRGPNEYNMLYGAQFSNDGKTIYLFTRSAPAKIFAYDLNGQFLKSIPLAISTFTFKAWFEDESAITVVTLPGPNNEVLCFQQTTGGDLLKKVPAGKHFQTGEEIFTNYTPGVVSFYITGTDTLFHYDTARNRIIPKFALEFGEKKLLNTPRELPGYYYTGVRGADAKWRTVMVNKKTLNTHYASLVNDFFGSIETQMFFFNDYYVESVPAITLKGRIDKALQNSNLTQGMRKKLTDLNNSITEDDNDIVFYGKLKK